MVRACVSVVELNPKHILSEKFVLLVYIYLCPNISRAQGSDPHQSTPTPLISIFLNLFIQSPPPTPRPLQTSSPLPLLSDSHKQTNTASRSRQPAPHK
jgi:hypothetical protein